MEKARPGEGWWSTTVWTRFWFESIGATFHVLGIPWNGWVSTIYRRSVFKNFILITHVIFTFSSAVWLYNHVCGCISSWPIVCTSKCNRRDSLGCHNFLCHFRRPDAIRAEDIGAWYTVLETITKISVLVNAFVLAFTSEFIPKLVYKMVYSGQNGDPSSKGTLIGYVNNSLASIDLKTLFTWENGTQPINPTQNLNYTRDYCR